MSIGSTYTKQPIRIGDKTSTAKALVDFGTIATDSFQGKSKAEHSGFQSEEGLLAGKIPNWREKSIYPFVLAAVVLICYIWCILGQRRICLHARGTGAHPPKVIPPDFVHEVQLAPLLSVVRGPS